MIGGPYDGCTTMLGSPVLRIPLNERAREQDDEARPYGVYVAAIREGEPVYLWRGEC